MMPIVHKLVSLCKHRHGRLHYGTIRCLTSMQNGAGAMQPLVSALRRPASAPYSALAAPQPDNSAPRTYSAHINELVDKIGKLTLLEVSQLNECLRKTLNIKDTPMMPMAGAYAPSAAGSKEQEAQEEAPQIQQTAFTVTLAKFDEKQKVSVIKEVKKLVEGMNLVQAKKFVESAPQTVKADISKAEAEAIKKALEAAGAVVEIS